MLCRKMHLLFCLVVPHAYTTVNTSVMWKGNKKETSRGHRWQSETMGGIVHRMLLNSSHWPDSAQLHRKHVHHSLAPEDFLKSRAQLRLYTVKRLKCEDITILFWVFSCLVTCFLRHASSMLWSWECWWVRLMYLNSF